MRLKGHAFFHATCSCGKSTYTYDKTSTESPDAYLRWAERYKACGQWFVAFTSPWVHLAYKRQLRKNSNVYGVFGFGGLERWNGMVEWTGMDWMRMM